MVDYNAQRQQRLRTSGTCVNGREHGPAVKGGRCARCWERKKRSEQQITRHGHVICEDCSLAPPGDDARGFRAACGACGMLLCSRCLLGRHAKPHLPPVPITVGLRVRVEGADGAWELCEITEVTSADFAFKALRDGSTGRCYIGKWDGLWEAVP